METDVLFLIFFSPCILYSIPIDRINRLAIICNGLPLLYCLLSTVYDSLMTDMRLNRKSLPLHNIINRAIPEKSTIMQVMHVMQ